jgi:hypothetical protein
MPVTSPENLESITVDFDPDGKLVAAGGGDNSVVLWGVVAGTTGSRSGAIVTVSHRGYWYTLWGWGDDECPPSIQIDPEHWDRYYVYGEPPSIVETRQWLTQVISELELE